METEQTINNSPDSGSGFSNDQVNTSSIPRMEAAEYEPLHTSSLYVSMIVLGVFLLFVLAGTCILAFTIEKVRPFLIWLIAGEMAVFSLLAFIEYKAFGFRGYVLRNHDILFRDGWLWKSWTVIPFNRIQHMEINQGPLDRLFELATLQLFTAGGAASDLEIGGLNPEKAAAIKEFITIQNTALQNDESAGTI